MVMTDTVITGTERLSCSCIDNSTLANAVTQLQPPTDVGHAQQKKFFEIWHF